LGGTAISVLKGRDYLQLGSPPLFWMHAWEEIDSNTGEMTHEKTMGRGFVFRDTI
jgi:hypothetical protein